MIKLHAHQQIAVDQVIEELEVKRTHFTCICACTGYG